jgi:hypothetical protein
MEKWESEHWFMKLNEEGKSVDRTGNVTIPKDQLLLGRTRGWQRQNAARWNIADEKFLVKNFTSGNKVTPFVDGEAYVTGLLQDRPWAGRLREGIHDNVPNYSNVPSHPRSPDVVHQGLRRQPAE